MTISEKRFSRDIIFIICMLCICSVALVFSAEPAFGQSKSSVRKTRVKNVAVTSVNHTTLNVSWRHVKGAEGYYIYASKSRLSRFHRIKTVYGGNKTNVDIGNCTPGKTYYFKVQAFADKKTGKKSNAMAGETKKGASAAKLKQPVFTAEKYGSTEIKIKISKMSGAKGFIIYRAKTKEGKYAKVKAVASTKRTYIDSGLKPSTKYYYKVRAYRVVSGKKQYSVYSSIQWAKTKAKKNGNASEYDLDHIKYESSVLKGATAYFLGSSVTYGKGSGGVSFVEMLEKKYGMIVTKKAISGTTLVGKPYNKDLADESYVARMTRDEKELMKNPPDFFVCQLSTNDANPQKGIKLGSITAVNVRELDAFDTTTVAGAIEYITEYAQEKMNRPVIFYVQTKFNMSVSNAEYVRNKAKYDQQLKNYEKMIGILYQAKQEKWGDQLQIVDFWNNSQYTSTDDLLLCMYDTIHPTKAGYLKKYLKVFGDYFKSLISTLKGESQTQAEPQEPESIEEPQKITEEDPSTETFVTTPDLNNMDLTNMEMTEDETDIAS